MRERGRHGGCAYARRPRERAASSLLYLEVNGFTTALPLWRPHAEAFRRDPSTAGRRSLVQQVRETWIDQGALP